jgi:hypothetical protein
MNEKNVKSNTSKQELSILSKALEKSIEQSVRVRFTWIALIAGFLIGAAVATFVFILSRPEQTKIPGNEVLLRRSYETLTTVKDIRSNVDRLITDIKNYIDSEKDKDTGDGKQELQEAETEKTPSSATEPEKSTETLSDSENRVDLSRHTVYLHYNRKENKKIMEDFAIFLKNKGYVVPDIERVADKRRDIRYFYDEDREGAQCLKTYFDAFFSGSANIQGINVVIMDLTGVYPRASRGAIELWINF